MAAKRDYYEVLGINRDASDDDIKRAYRKMAKQYHPDLHPGDKEAEAKFKEVNEAYATVSDAQKRARYDQFGHEDPAAGGAGGYGGGYGGAGFEDLGDIFSSFFGGDIFGGGRRRRNGPQPGNDLEYELRISFEEAAFGAKKEITITREALCNECGGTGARKGTAPETCPDCHGSGQVVTYQNTPLGRIQTQRPCSRCGGKGQIIKEPCSRCGGRGRVRKSPKISLNIPAGIDNGQRINLRGEGEPGINGGPAGDLYVRIAVAPHKLFKRDGYNLRCEIPITFPQAALGAKIDVPTLEGKVEYDIPEGTQTGTTFRLRNRGIQMLNSKNRGDLYITVKVEVPRALNAQQKKLLKDYDSSMTGREHRESKSFFDKMKDILGN